MNVSRAPRLVEIREDFNLPGPSEVAEASASILVGEAIDNLGVPQVTSELYHAIVEDVPCALEGVVNANRRLYLDLAKGHVQLCSEAGSRFIDGELGHAQGQETQEIPVRFLGGSVVEQEDGTSLTLGRFGILKTTEGTNTWVLYQAGFPVGVSLVGLCYMTEAVLNDESPFAAANEGFIGEEITFCAGLRLRKYDIVRRASFNTYFPTTEEARAALLAVDEAGLFPTSPSPVTPPATNEPGDAAEEEEMTPQELAKLLADHPEAAASYRAGVVEDVSQELKANNPLAGASDKELATAATILEHMKPGDDDPEKGIKAVVEQSNADRRRVEELEAENKANATALEEIKRELASTKLRTAILEAVDLKATGSTNGALAKAHVLSLVDRDKVSSVEEASELFDSAAEMCAKVAGIQESQADSPSRGDPADAVKPDEVPVPTTEGAKPAVDAAAPVAPGLLGKNRYAVAMKNRKRAGGVL